MSVKPRKENHNNIWISDFTFLPLPDSNNWKIPRNCVTINHGLMHSFILEKNSATNKFKSSEKAICYDSIIDLLGYSIWPLTIVKCWNINHQNNKHNILMKFMIKMIDLIDVIPYMAVMTEISAFDTCQCHRNSTGNWVTE